MARVSVQVGAEPQQVSRPRFEEGNYNFTITKQQVSCEIGPKNSIPIEALGEGQEYTRQCIEITFHLEGGYTGMDTNETFYLTKNAMWKFRNLSDCVGLPDPYKDGVLDFDPEEYEGTEGVVYMKRKDGDKWLKPARYLSQDQQENLPDSDIVKPLEASDDVPF